MNYIEKLKKFQSKDLSGSFYSIDYSLSDKIDQMSIKDAFVNRSRLGTHIMAGASTPELSPLPQPRIILQSNANKLSRFHRAAVGEGQTSVREKIFDKKIGSMLKKQESIERNQYRRDVHRRMTLMQRNKPQKKETEKVSKTFVLNSSDLMKKKRTSKKVLLNYRNKLGIDYFTNRIVMEFIYRISRGKYGEKKKNFEINPFIFCSIRLLMKKYEDIYSKDKPDRIKKVILQKKAKSYERLISLSKSLFFREIHERGNLSRVIQKKAIDKIGSLSSRGKVFGSLQGKKHLLLTMERVHHLKNSLNKYYEIERMREEQEQEKKAKELVRLRMEMSSRGSRSSILSKRKKLKKRLRKFKAHAVYIASISKGRSKKSRKNLKKKSVLGSMSRFGSFYSSKKSLSPVQPQKSRKFYLESPDRRRRKETRNSLRIPQDRAWNSGEKKESFARRSKSIFDQKKTSSNHSVKNIVIEAPAFTSIEAANDSRGSNIERDDILLQKAIQKEMKKVEKVNRKRSKTRNEFSSGDNGSNDRRIFSGLNLGDSKRSRSISKPFVIKQRKGSSIRNVKLELSNQDQNKSMSKTSPNFFQKRSASGVRKRVKSRSNARRCTNYAKRAKTTEKIFRQAGKRTVSSYLKIRRINKETFIEKSTVIKDSKISLNRFEKIVKNFDKNPIFVEPVYKKGPKLFTKILNKKLKNRRNKKSKQQMPNIDKLASSTLNTFKNQRVVTASTMAGTFGFRTKTSGFYKKKIKSGKTPHSSNPPCRLRNLKGERDVYEHKRSIRPGPVSVYEGVGNLNGFINSISYLSNQIA